MGLDGWFEVELRSGWHLITILIQIVVLELNLDLLLKELIFSLLYWIILVIVSQEALVRRIRNPAELAFKVRADTEIVVHFPEHVLIETLVELGVGDELALARLFIELLFKLHVELIV